jgi:hypothetical protein
MIGLFGAKIWVQNRVDFQLTGIALGTIVTIGTYHLVRLIAPPHLLDEQRAEAGVEA